MALVSLSSLTFLHSPRQLIAGSGLNGAAAAAVAAFGSEHTVACCLPEHVCLMSLASEHFPPR